MAARDRDLLRRGSQHQVAFNALDIQPRMDVKDNCGAKLGQVKEVWISTATDGYVTRSRFVELYPELAKESANFYEPYEGYIEVVRGVLNPLPSLYVPIREVADVLRAKHVALGSARGRCETRYADKPAELTRSGTMGLTSRSLGARRSL